LANKQHQVENVCLCYKGGSANNLLLATLCLSINS